MSGVRIARAGTPEVIAASDGRLTLSVPIQIKRRGGRKLITLPTGEAAQPRPWDLTATPMQMALAKGHRWLAMLESGQAKSIKALAARQKIDNSYMCRLLNLTTLAPDIVAAILDDTLPQNVTVHELAISPPVLWEEQRERIGGVGEAL
ncbi:MAG: LacI family transcriptional regulator [Candidatus Accumulibacter sp.]|uniref:LacI family transcriptional regulator n=1 Tax=Accumulibacter sp. TaxID=2053492 RepID=UPI001AC45B6A|nr:LacI family transcriptional regulator [Accumulibacter sp.]MBN8518871.1 LacI family transcriptional regulator [Accumulibacter sp.]MBO3712745.1 LacI family transcriptional regulator [Accumulibacter sp.]